MSWNPFEPVQLDNVDKVDRKAQEKKRAKRKKQLDRITSYYAKMLSKLEPSEEGAPSLRRGAYTSLSTRFSSSKGTEKREVTSNLPLKRY